MVPALIIPVAVFSFLGGAVLGRSRRGLSMLPPERQGPLPGVPIAAWRRFVTVMVVRPRSDVGPRGRLGYFGLDARRLADVGFMRGAHKERVGDEVGTWVGEWVPPLSRESFLASAGAQHEALARSTRRMLPKVLPHVGREIDGRRATLSGLLAAGHLAGEEGLGSWAADATVRRKFRATTANFERANGIF
jgi:hypothetical protein